MKLSKGLLIALGLIIASLGVYILITVFPSLTATRSQSDEASQTSKNYIIYNGSGLEGIKNQRVIYFFNALWSQPDQEATRNFRKDLSAIPKDMTVISIDYDKYPELTTRYGVTIQQTFIQVDENQKAIQRATGLNQISELDKTFTQRTAVPTISSASVNSAPKTTGSYISYTNGDLTSYSGESRVLFFKASWCPSCIAANKDINSKLSSIPTNLTIIAVDYDSFPELKKTYGVTVQHTFVKINSQNDIIKKTIGLNTLEEIIAFSN
jgi:thioredoxin 1